MTKNNQLLDPAIQGDGKIRASLELLYHVSREFAEALELRTVLQRVLLLSMQTVGAVSGSIIVLDDAGKPVESAMITGSHIYDHTTQRLHITLERGLAGWVARNQQAALIDDTSRDERWISRQYETDEPGAPKSALSLPIQTRERLVGVITLAHNETGFFTPDHLALVQAIADQAGIAILNARLYADSQRQARVMTALADSAAAIAESLDLDDVLKRILEQISQVMQVEAISLALIDPQKDELVFHASIGWENVTEVHPRIRLGTSVVGWVARQGQGTVVADTGSDTRFDDETIHRTGIPAKAIACAPIRLQEQVIGVIEAINPVEGSFDGDALLVLTGIGSLAGTAIRHAQLFEQLQAAHQRYRELFEDSVDPILISDWEGHILEANRQAVIATGFDTEELRQMPVGRLHNVGEGILEQRFEGSSSGDTIFYESTLKTKDQKEVPIQVYVRQTLIDGVPHLQWILRDISERKRLDTVRDDLLAMVYHDLQSPLSNVLSSLELARSILPQSDDPTLKNLVGIALRSADRVQRLINSLLDTNRLEEGQPIGNRQPSQIADIIKEAIEVILPTLEAKHHKLERVLEEHLPLVRVDADMIRRVLINLLENAIKFSPSRSKIQVGASQKGEWVNVWVQDNGPGIPLADHERIFLKFTRLDYQNSPKGLGLGLAFCRLAIEGHGGRIWVESDIGKGARFTFTLPTNTE